MNLVTTIAIDEYEHKFDYRSKILLLGSCFSENIGSKLVHYKFNTLINPFGIIFNTASIQNIINRVVLKKHFTINDVFFYNESWHCYEVHSQCSAHTSQELLTSLNTILDNFYTYISTATHFVLTLGTSWVYTLKSNDAIVANCYKMPQNNFNKQLISAQENQQNIEKCIKLLHKINSSCHIIITVSPVRHSKDGFVENQISKANLLLAVFGIMTKRTVFYNANYFASYEIMMDELRDYRFYAQDMLHPNQTAIDYIWEKFCTHYIETNCYKSMKLVHEIKTALNHKPFDVNSKSHRFFLDSIDKKIRQLQQEQPKIVF